MINKIVMHSFRNTALALAGLATVMWQPWKVLAQAPEPARGVKFAQIESSEMKEWLTYLSSDALQGRQVFTEGYGLASAYVADHLKSWGAKPLGDAGTYFERVSVRGYKSTRNSSVTVVVNGTPRTFKHGDHVTFPFSAGGKQTLTFTGVEFIGYGLPGDYADRDVTGKLVVWMPNLAPTPPGGGGRVRAGGPVAISTRGAAAAIGFAAGAIPADRALVQAQEALQKASEAVQQARAELQGRGRGRAAVSPPDFTTPQRVDALSPPQLTGDETFFDALLGNRVFADLKAKAEKGEPLAPTSWPMQVTIAVDNAFELVSEQFTRNVVGMVEGSDPALKNTYVIFGAHLDHIGYGQTGVSAQPTTSSCRQRSPAAQAAVTQAGKVIQNPGRRGGAAAGAGAADAGPGDGAGRGASPASPTPLPLGQRDVINNGADDDGSGSTAELAVAKAFATGPKPKRSVVFIWHTGEEAGLYGSRYNADFPVVPLDNVQAQLNLDMVGRDDCDNLEGDYSNTLFVVGADRISTDLHNLIVETNERSAKPLTLDYELNDLADPESVYTRSDHFSYAAKGIPIAFFTTGLHPDYHKVSDTVDKILFPKMARIAQLVYEAGFSIANTERVLDRDNRGSRTGFQSKAAIIRKDGPAKP